MGDPKFTCWSNMKGKLPNVVRKKNPDWNLKTIHWRRNIYDIGPIDLKKRSFYIYHQLIYAYQISFQYLQSLQKKWKDIANYWNFSKSKGHNSVKKCSILPKTELDLHILTINLYTKFHLSMCNLCNENEQKLQILGICLSPRGITLSKDAPSYPKQNLT
jgi:hypothetical protein